MSYTFLFEAPALSGSFLQTHVTQKFRQLCEVSVNDPWPSHSPLAPRENKFTHVGIPTDFFQGGVRDPHNLKLIQDVAEAVSVDLDVRLFSSGVSIYHTRAMTSGADASRAKGQTDSILES